MLKKHVSLTRYEHWSAASICGHCFKTGKTSMTKSTWYLYSLILGLTQARKATKLKLKKGSYLAARPNHA